jgi:broad specificity phosphatase PhoE
VSDLRLVLLRHGETPSNVLGLLDSLPPGPSLTDLGRRQAEAAAEHLAGEPVVAVYASVAVRAQETAAPVAARHGLAVEVIQDVHEVFVGDLECSNEPDDVATFVSVYRSWNAGDLDVPMPGGESGSQLLARFLPVVERLRRTHSDGVVVLVSHGMSIRLATAALAANITTEFADRHFLPNGQHITIQPDGDGWRCLAWSQEPRVPAPGATPASDPAEGSGEG